MTISLSNLLTSSRARCLAKSFDIVGILEVDVNPAVGLASKASWNAPHPNINVCFIASLNVPSSKFFGTTCGGTLPSTSEYTSARKYRVQLSLPDTLSISSSIIICGSSGCDSLSHSPTVCQVGVSLAPRTTHPAIFKVSTRQLRTSAIRLAKCVLPLPLGPTINL